MFFCNLVQRSFLKQVRHNCNLNIFGSRGWMFVVKFIQRSIPLREHSINYILVLAWIFTFQSRVTLWLDSLQTFNLAWLTEAATFKSFHQMKETVPFILCMVSFAVKFFQTTKTMTWKITTGGVKKNNGSIQQKNVKKVWVWQIKEHWTFSKS